MHWVGRRVFATGPIHGVTQTQQVVEWEVSHETAVGDRPLVSNSRTTAIVRATTPQLGGAKLQLIDTPGIDEVDGEQRAELARQVARQAELILFVISGDMTRLEFEALAELREASKPILLVLH